MGSYFTQGATQMQIVAQIKEEYPSMIKSCRKGRTLWGILECKDGVKLIGCFLLIPDKWGWGYKPMDETGGPCYYDCPKAYLKEVDPPLNEWSAEWRKKVLEQ